MFILFIINGVCVNTSFGSVLKKTIHNMTAVEEASLGWSKDEISVYSIRKGWMTHTAGIPGGPDFAATSLRAGHSIGIDDRYVFQSIHQDCFCGRAAAGKNVQSPSFGDLPPRFKPEFISTVDWSAYLTCYPRLPQSFKAVVPYLIATLVTKWEWFKANVGSDHPLLSNLHMQPMVDALKPHIISDGLFSCNSTGMKASGVPLNVILLERQQDFESRMSALVAATEANKLEMMDKLPALITTNILTRLEVNGAVPVTNDDLNRATTRIQEQLQELILQIHSTRTVAQNNDTAAAAIPVVTLPEVQPKDYVFPHVITAKLAMMLWWFPSPPNPLYGPNPLMPFHQWDRRLISKKLTKNSYSKVKGVCELISKLGGIDANVSLTQFDDKFITGFSKFKRLAGFKRDRSDESSVMTLYDNLKQAESALAAEVAAVAT